MAGNPPLVGTMLLRGTSRRVAVSVLLLEIVYLPVVGIGTSLRGFTPVIPLVMVCVGLVVNEISERLGRVLPKPVAVMIPFDCRSCRSGSPMGRREPGLH